jgi:hypothetical protein
MKHEFPVFSVAISKQDYFSNVTLKYIDIKQSKKAVFIQNRFSELSEWLEQHLKQNHQTLCDPDDEKVIKEEHDHLQSLIYSENQKLPKSINDFKNHPV